MTGLPPCSCNLLTLSRNLLFRQEGWSFFWNCTIWLHQVITTAQYSECPVLQELPARLLMMEQSLLSLLYLLLQDLALLSHTLLLSPRWSSWFGKVAKQFFPCKNWYMAHKGFHPAQLQSHLSPVSLPRTRAGSIHQGEGSEGRNLQKVLSHLEALTKL